MKYHKGDIFVHKKHGTIAILTRVGEDTYDFMYSCPTDEGDHRPPWTRVKDKPINRISEAVDGGFVVLYRPLHNFLEEDLFEVD